MLLVPIRSPYLGMYLAPIRLPLKGMHLGPIISQHLDMVHQSERDRGMYLAPMIPQLSYK